MVAVDFTKLSKSLEVFGVDFFSPSHFLCTRSMSHVVEKTTIKYAAGTVRVLEIM